MHFAPVLIPTLNRYNHFKRCVESLSECLYANETVLVVSLDYPKDKCHWEGYEKIKEFLKRITGFQSVRVIERRKNYGAVRNYFKSIEEVFEDSEMVIFSEDDNVFSKNFLAFMNQALLAYRDNQQIYAICGYVYPIDISHNKEDCYISRTFSAWGYATWRNRTVKQRYDAHDIIGCSNSLRQLIDIYKMAPAKVFKVLRSRLNCGIYYGDYVVSLENIRNNTYSLFPTVTKVVNHGHDGTGEHCGFLEDSMYAKQSIDKREKYTFEFPLVPQEDRRTNARIRKYFRLTAKAFVKVLITIAKVILSDWKHRRRHR